jgi:HNH endonuclease
MLCLFCKTDASTSRSVEHIIPESLGNTKSILPAGVVCDKCNNYFARKVEKPLLDCIDLIALRFHQRIPNKKGRVPPLAGTVGESAPVIAYFGRDDTRSGLLDASPEAVELIFRQKADVLNFPGYGDQWESSLTSRFLAKAALEGLASRLLSSCSNTAFATEPALDPIRNYARRGSTVLWPYHTRRIYDADKPWTLPTGESVQRVWEWEILETDSFDHFFVLVLIGLELTINYQAPDIRGYLEWLDRHNTISPLYYGLNADHPENEI